MKILNEKDDINDDINDDMISNSLQRKHMVFLVFNRVEGDSRVIRVAESALKLGYEATIVGLGFKKKTLNIEINNIPIVLVTHPIFEMREKGTWVEEMSERSLAQFVDGSLNSFYQEVIKLKPDLLYSHDMIGLRLGAYLIPRIANKGFITPWIHDIHEYVEGLRGHVPYLYTEDSLKWEQDHIHEPDHLITVSSPLAAILEKNYKLQVKIDVLGNMPKYSEMSLSYKPILREKLQLTSKQKLVVYVGRVSHTRGIHTVVESLPYLDEDIVFACLSNDKGAYVNNLYEKAEKLKVSHRFFFHPYVPVDEVTSFIQKSDIGIIPLVHFGNGEVAMPNKLSEYLHAEIPIISSDTLAMTEYIQKTNIGDIFIAEDPKDCARSIKEVIENYSKYKKNITQSIKHERSWERNEEKLKGIFLQSFAIYNDSVPADNLKSLRVFHGIASNSGQPLNIADGERELGLRSDAIIMADNPLDFDSHYYNSARSAEEVSGYVARFSKKYDVFHFYVRSFFFSRPGIVPPSMLDMLALRAAGKIVVVHYQGSEMRFYSEFKKLSPFNYVDEMPELVKSIPEVVQRRLTQIAREVADITLVNDSEMQSYVKDARIVPRALNLKEFSYIGLVSSEKELEEQGPLIVHSPSKPIIKGTKYIDKAITELKEEGYKFRYVVNSGVSHNTAIENIRKADIYIDQLRIGWYGVVSVEAMAMGKPVITYIRDDLVHEFKETDPFKIADPHTIKQAIKELVKSKKEREGYSERGYRFVRDVHCHQKIAKITTTIYQDILMNRKPAEITAVMDYFSFLSNQARNINTALNNRSVTVSSIVGSNQLYYGAAGRIKRQLRYRLGATMIEKSRNFTGWLSMPWALFQEVRQFKIENIQHNEARLPAISMYQDTYEVESVKKHLSYRLGSIMLEKTKSPIGWIELPWALNREIKSFQYDRKNSRK